MQTTCSRATFGIGCVARRKHWVLRDRIAVAPHVMKKVALALALAFAVLGGAVAVSAVNQLFEKRHGLPSVAF
ncbi:MAG: hypothetical protein WA709_35730 [Stellaceae bacterium]